jgi:hypothetical protein
MVSETTSGLVGACQFMPSIKNVNLIFFLIFF